jgi:serine/threonine protein kinase
MSYENHQPGTYGYNQRRWFESLSNYEPKPDFDGLLDETMPHGWRLDHQSIWTVASPPDGKLAEQGWKIHISARTADASAILRLCISVLCRRELHFKFAADSWILGEMNGKLWPRESASKFITVYPGDSSAFLSVGEELVSLLATYSGPYILSDRRWPGSRCVFYRYGGFRERSRLSLEGSRVFLLTSRDGELVEDQRRPYFHLPSGFVDPLLVEPPKPRPQPYMLKSDQYEVRAAVNFSSRGGVYKAYDNYNHTPVILKEARPFVEIGRARSEATQVLKKESELLRLLEETGYFVKPMDFFTEWEHSYLVEEHVAGDMLAHYILAHNPLYTSSVNSASVRDYVQQVSSIWLKIAHAVKSAHTRGVVIGDLSVTNVIVNDLNEVTLIDLEGAHLDGDEPIGLFTPGFTMASSWETGAATRGSDTFGLGALMFASLALANTFVDYYPPARGRFLAELAQDLDLPDELVRLIARLLAEPRLESLAIDDVISSLVAIRRRLVCQPSPMPRLAVPADERLSNANRCELRRAVSAVHDTAREYLQIVADPTRRDRLFPADMLVFSTNPLSVAYGACGVLHVLHHIGGATPRRFVDWALAAPVSNDDYPPGLYLGKSGVAWVFDELGYQDLAQKLLRESGRHPLLWNAADVLHGAAGFGLACLRFWSVHHDDRTLRDADHVGNWLIENASAIPSGVHWNTGTTYNVGYAKGGSGIALFLLYLSRATGNDRYQTVGQQALNADVQHAAWSGRRFLGFPEVPEGGPSPYWYSGTAGIVTTLLRFHAVAPAGSSARLIEQYEVDLQHKYAKFPQLFGGLAGMGNALLDLWYFLGDDKYLWQAWQIAEGILLHGIERPEGTTFPGAGGLRECSDFATGTAGVSAFLFRLLATDSLHPEPSSVANFNFTLDELIYESGIPRPIIPR